MSKGNSKLKRYVIGGVAALAALVVGVAVFDPAARDQIGAWKIGALGKTSSAAPGASAAPGGGGPAGGQHATTVITAEAVASDFPIRRTSVGFLSSPSVVNVNARVGSAVVAVAVKDGQSVKAGDLLFKLDDRSLQAALAKDQASLAKDQAAHVSSEADFKRAEDLLAKGAGTQQAYDQQLATLKGLEAAIAADQALIASDQVQLSYATITAPASGRLGAINTTVGNIVTASGSQGSASSTPLVTITQMSPLQVTFNLPEDDLPMLHQAFAARKPDAVSLTLPNGTDVVATGPLDFIDSSVDTTTGTIAARASIANPDEKLWPGQYVQIGIQFGTLQNAVAVPTVAVQQGQKGPYVFVVGSDDKVSIRQITVAMTDGGRTAITSGLSAGERVVVEGQARLKDGTSVREQKAGAPGGGASGKPDAKVSEEAPAGGASTTDGGHHKGNKPVDGGKTASADGGA